MHAQTSSDEIATLLVERIAAAAPALHAAFAATLEQGVGCAWLDDVLPPALFAMLAALPARSRMTRRRSLGERKHVLAEPALMPPALAAFVQALATRQVAHALAAALGLPELAPDPELYNGGLTVMAPGDFMRPHLDNSHDHAGRHRRRLVLLFYLAQRWQPAWRGALMLWRGPRRANPLTIGYAPNRLVLMEAGDAAWHSVARVEGPCVRSNVTAYYYEPEPSAARVRLTRFAGWPGERGVAMLLALQFRARTIAARAGLRRIVRNRHRRATGAPRAR